ncbi:MAG TPA: hypothetical protein DCF82_23305 [Marinobacter hydrocarbonoclasticus]|uniref:Uncharacterized protein n=1 Tax=Marinobacter nauticus TaxID=2743 RepID=A0A3B8WVY2_MARNT|nr:hypothetical protein [Marinobacter nauticus]
MPGEQFTQTPVYDRGVLPISAGADATAAITSSRIGPFGDRAQAVRLSVSGANARLKFGDDSVTVTTSTGIQMQDGMKDVLRIPAGATHLAIIREAGTDATVNYVELQ